MRALLLTIAYKIGTFSCLNDTSISILCYHSFSNKNDRYSIPVSFVKKQLAKIGHQQRFISLDNAVSMLYSRNVYKNAVVFTVDDGYKDVLSILPFTKKYHIPVAIFVLSDPYHADRKELDHNGKLLTTKELKFLLSQGWTIGCHSATHANFKTLDPEQMQKEILSAKQQLEKRLGVTVHYFAYPKGTYNKSIQTYVKRAGYRAAFSIEPGGITIKTPRFSMPRVTVDKTHQLREFPALYHDSTFFLRKITNPLRLWNLLLRV